MKQPGGAIKTLKALTALPRGEVVWAVIPYPPPARLERHSTDGNWCRPGGWGIYDAPLRIPFGPNIPDGYYFINYWYAVAYMLRLNGGEPNHD